MTTTGLEIVVVSAAPLNGETPLQRQTGLLTPVEQHYVRNHFGMPEHPGTLEIGGMVGRPTTITVAELRERPLETHVVTLECAGNGRRFLEPAVKGEQWSLGAVGTAEWRGVRLGILLDEAEVLPAAVEVVFEGADSGMPAVLDHAITFERSLPVAAAGDALVAIEMNGRPLPAEHGAPIRLIVPGRYGMASVKWLRRITAVEAPFRGFFQADRYVVDGEPLGPIAPRALITSPADGATVAAGSPLAIRGYAWSGRGPIAAVNVSDDGGRSWQSAVLGAAQSPVAWRSFELAWSAPARLGDVALVARATDASGATQPLEQNWNSLGYMNNAAQPVTVRVAG